MALLKNILAVIGAIALLAFLVIGIWAYDFFSPENANKDPFDWSTTQKYPSPDGIVEAVVEHGIINTGANTAPIYKVTIQTIDNPKEWRHHLEVWESSSKQPPTIKWQTNNSMAIHQQPSKLSIFEPKAALSTGTYTITLVVDDEHP